jgi:hypothetical protein
MKLEYEILPANNGKQKILYYENDILICTELYSQGSEILPIRQGYRNRAHAKWLEMKKDLLNSGGIFTKMRTVANTGLFAGNFVSVMAVLDMGILGYPDEAGLESLLRLAGWGFTENQKQTIDTYFANNGFQITISDPQLMRINRTSEEVPQTTLAEEVTIEAKTIKLTLKQRIIIFIKKCLLNLHNRL